MRYNKKSVQNILLIIHKFPQVLSDYIIETYVFSTNYNLRCCFILYSFKLSVINIIAHYVITDHSKDTFSITQLQSIVFIKARHLSSMTPEIPSDCTIPHFLRLYKREFNRYFDV